MNKIKKGLGRGLSSLIGESKSEVKNNVLNLNEIVPNKYQPRKKFDEENLNDLTNSIKEQGVIQPIIVRKSKTENTKYEVLGLNGIDISSVVEITDNNIIINKSLSSYDFVLNKINIDLNLIIQQVFYKINTI